LDPYADETLTVTPTTISTATANAGMPVVVVTQVVTVMITEGSCTNQWTVNAALSESPGSWTVEEPLYFDLINSGEIETIFETWTLSATATSQKAEVVSCTFNLAHFNKGH
jgi:hypothetical protein